jgi:hypothetical protein
VPFDVPGVLSGIVPNLRASRLRAVPRLSGW